MRLVAVSVASFVLSFSFTFSASAQPTSGLCPTDGGDCLSELGGVISEVSGMTVTGAVESVARIAGPTPETAVGRTIVLDAGEIPPAAPAGMYWEYPFSNFSDEASRSGKETYRLEYISVRERVRTEVFEVWDRVYGDDAKALVRAAYASPNDPGPHEAGLGILHQAVVNRGTSFTPDAARTVRLALMSAGLPGE